MKLRIEQFYRLTIPKFTNSTSIFKRVINGLIVKEYQCINKLCDKYVKNKYPKCQKKLNDIERKEKIVISFTTIPLRISNIPFMLKSIFNQTVMPDRVILWITDELCESEREKITRLLEMEVKQGLEIRFVKDVRVHTKYYYAFLENPDALVITVDDDMIYPENLIEKLLEGHYNNPHCVIATRVHEITFFNKNIQLYGKWNRLAPGSNRIGHNLLATGVGGVLYPPNCLYSDWKNSDLFLKLCPTADDIWLKVMEALKGTKVVKLKNYTRETFTFSGTQDIALAKINVEQGRNDILLKQCQEYYKFSSELLNQKDI